MSNKYKVSIMSVKNVLLQSNQLFRTLETIPALHSTKYRLIRSGEMCLYFKQSKALLIRFLTILTCPILSMSFIVLLSDNKWPERSFINRLLYFASLAFHSVVKLLENRPTNAFLPTDFGSV